jgi:hypothetical protein
MAQDIAVASFAAAFIRGRLQAHADGVLTITDRLWIEQALAKNDLTLRDHLGVDLRAFIEAQRLNLPGVPTSEIAAALDRRFGARLENLYGGVLWSVQEAGYRAGVASFAVLAPSIAVSAAAASGGTAEDDVGLYTPSPQAVERKHRSAATAAAAAAVLAMTSGTDHGAKRAQLVALVADALDETPEQTDALLSDGRVEVGLLYLTQQDVQVCESCGAAEGEYYPPEEPPLPGEVCVGGGNCRCMLEMTVRVI